MLQHTPVCAAPSKKYPEGRTGTPAGSHLHRRASEPLCDVCREADLQEHKARYVRDRAQGLPDGVLACEQATRKYPGGMRGTPSGHTKHKRFNQESCAECREAHRKAAADRYSSDPQKFNRQHRLWRHNVTTERYAELLELQGNRCAICRATESRGRSFEFHIDHDHDCCPGKRSCGKCVRGLLCALCNTALGAFGDDPDRLLTAAQYLLGHRNILTEVKSDAADQAGGGAPKEAGPARDAAS